LLVEAAWRIVRSRSEETVVLRAWAAGIATRHGKRVAVMALARRLAGILYVMWRDGAAFDGRQVRAASAAGASRLTWQCRRVIAMTESGAASAMQLMAAGESR